MYVCNNLLEEIFWNHDAKCTAICTDFCVIERLSGTDNDNMIGLYFIGNGVECVVELPRTAYGNEQTSYFSGYLGHGEFRNIFY